MNFQLTDDQNLIKQTIRSFVEDNVVPNATQWDEEERFPTEIIGRARELGLFGMAIPAEYGGTDLDTVTNATVIEELARGDGSIALTVASHNSLCCSHIVKSGTNEQKEKYLPKLANGSWLGAWGLTEPGSGSDASGLKTRAIKEGDEWVINGAKTFITQGSVGKVAVILAYTEPEKKQRGITAFIIEHGTEGFTVGNHLKKLGMRSSDTVELLMDNVRISDAQRLGEVNMGFLDTLAILDAGRIGIAALAVGLAQGACEAAYRYSMERKQFGTPIANFQAIQGKIANMSTTLEGSRLLVQRAAWLRDTGQPFGKEASMAKLMASEMAVKVCEEAVQIHGGYGYTREFPVERFWRDSKLCTIGEGTSEIQRMVIARHIFNALPNA